MIQKLEFVADASGPRLDKFLSQRTGLSRTSIQRLIKDEHILVNKKPAKPSLKLEAGDRVEVTIPPSTPTTLAPEAIPLSIVYEDEDLLVIDKPTGLPVHPSPGHPRHTLVNAVLAHWPNLPDQASLRPGIVHRLDKDTSGLLIVAKTSTAHAHLATQLKARTVTKRYLVLVHGHLSPEQGAIEAPIGRHPRHRQRMAVVTAGRQARTLYQVIRYLGRYTLVEATLETGRTHQIRVHFSAIGYPVVGDAVYGVKSPFLARQFVHAHYLGFRLPSSGQWAEFHSPLPPDLEQALRQIES